MDSWREELFLNGSKTSGSPETSDAANVNLQHAAVSGPGTSGLSSLQGVVQGAGDQRDASGTPGSHFADEQEIVQNPESRLSRPFQVDTSLIQAVPTSQQAAELKELGLQVFNQDEFEEGVMAQVDTAMAAEEKERMERILRKELKTVEDDIRPCKQELQNIEKVIQLLTPQAAVNKDIARRLVSVRQKKEVKAKQLKKLKAKKKSLALKLNCNLDGLDDEDNTGCSTDETSLLEQAMLGLGSSTQETETERMVRMGEMTPFGTHVTQARPGTTAEAGDMPPGKGTVVVTEFEQYLIDQDAKRLQRKKSLKKVPSSAAKPSDCDKDVSAKSVKSKKMKKSCSDSSLDSRSQMDEFEARSQRVNFKKGRGSNFFDSKDSKHYQSESDYSRSSARKRKLYCPKLRHNFSEDRALSDVEVGDEMDEEPYGDDDNSYLPSSGDEQYSPVDAYTSSPKKGRHAYSGDDSGTIDLAAIKGVYPKKHRHSAKQKQTRSRAKDDGTAEAFQKRLKQWHKAEAKRKHDKLCSGEPDSDDDSDMEFDGGFRVPARMWNKLYRYQKTGVKWMWELHCQQAGGILGDEMGLGKTIQVIAFLTGLRHSKVRGRAGLTRYNGLGPSIVVCPATVLHQWVREFHTWSPAFRMGVLHSSGSYSGSEQTLIHNIFRASGILVMPFSSVVIYQDLLLQYDWHYVILDEGHKIRNPDAQCTIACKQFRTSHRLILSGSPVQNNLKELWSLFDFVFPGKLGTLPDFMAHFSVPIVQGGYSNATQVQVQTAYKCACVLRDTINPYLLRRMKADVKTSLSLPSKNEQVLFCRLTEHQREVYQEYIDSKECKQILSGNYMVFPGLVTLRKVCNHPDLSTGGPRVFNTDCKDDDKTLEYGYWQRSGKMIVMNSLLSLWKKQGHRVLLFTQSRQMLDILEDFVQKRDYTYLRMDGGTTIASRQPLIARFNSDTSIYIFLLTTRVGGLGVNLTGANRVVIYDPDWNPSTDTQARERAWRIGQTRPVTVYRLLTTGTIEEKIYHRQIFKQFLTNRILKDPKQRRFFKSNDLYELFTLSDDNPQDGTETSAIFAGTGSDVKVNLKAKIKVKGLKDKVNRFDRLKEIAEREQEADSVELEESDDEMAATSSTGDVSRKTAKMRELARLLSKRLVEKSETVQRDSNASTRSGESSASHNDSTREVNDPQSSNSCQDAVRRDSSDKDAALDMKSGMTSAAAKKKTKKKKRKHQGSVFEGEKIAHLDKHGSYRPDGRQVEGDKAQTSDDYVLQKLFKKTGVHSALQHDKIMMSSDPDYVLVEGEAQKVAAEAARALKQSRSRCLGAAPGVPTWTGQSGQAGAPTKPRFGQKKNSILTSKAPTSDEKKESPAKSKVGDIQPSTSYFDGTFAGTARTNPSSGRGVHDLMSSKDLLARMRTRNLTPVEARSQVDDLEGGVVATEPDAQQLELITDIRNFIAFGSRVDGKASTQELLDQFGNKIPTDSSVYFRAMLQQLCDFGVILQGIPLGFALNFSFAAWCVKAIM